MNENNLTSLKLSEKLSKGGCGVESDYYWAPNSYDNYTLYKFDKVKSRKAFSYKAYDILNDICVRHANKFFKDGHEKSATVFNLIYFRQKQKAEDFIWEHCVFKTRSKEKRK